MCVDYTDLNTTCPKDSYLFAKIKKLVDNSSGYKLLSFMDVDSKYNQIPMFIPNKMKTPFMTEQANYQYNIMPLKLKSTSVTYQRMMNNGTVSSPFVELHILTSPWSFLPWGLDILGPFVPELG